MIAGDKNKAIGIDMRRPNASDPWKEIRVIRKKLLIPSKLKRSGHNFYQLKVTTEVKLNI